jgi:hypothetical protein
VDEREHVQEVRFLEEAIQQTDKEIEETLIQTAKEKIAEFEREALELQGRRRALFGEIEKIDERFLELSEVASEAVPKKRIQTSSKRWVTLTKTIQMPKLIWNIFESPSKEFSDKIEEHIVPAIPRKLENAFSDGWALKAGERVEPEELDSGNSKEVPVFSLPDIFSSFDMGDKWITDLYFSGRLR